MQGSNRVIRMGLDLSKYTTNESRQGKRQISYMVNSPTINQSVAPSVLLPSSGR